MKKVFIIALFCVFGFSQMNAQVSFKPGIRGGLNFSHFTKGDYYNEYNYNGYYEGYYYGPNTPNNREYSSKTDFYLGLYGALKLTKYYTLQPEIDYSRQGSTAKLRVLNGFTERKLDVSYLSLGIINKFTFNKFNIHVGPSVDFVVEKNFDVDSDLDLAFTLGAGYNFTKNFGIEARVKKGIIPVLDFSDGNHSNVVFQTGITYTFDVK